MRLAIMALPATRLLFVSSMELDERRQSLLEHHVCVLGVALWWLHPLHCHGYRAAGMLLLRSSSMPAGLRLLLPDGRLFCHSKYIIKAYGTVVDQQQQGLLVHDRAKLLLIRASLKQ
jgi:hypothetical protein